MPRRSATDDAKKSLHIVTSSDSFAYVEAYKVLRTNLIYAADAMGEQCKVILIASSIPSEGKSNVSVNLAITLAQAGKRVILLDCDLRKGTLHRYLRSSRQLTGLTDVLQEEASLQESIHHYKDLEIDVLFAGASPDNPSELVGSPRMGRLLRTLSAQYDFVLCDTPPIGVVSDALALGRYADGAVMVVSFDRVLRQSALSTKAQLENSSIPILGAILSMYDAKEARSTGNSSYGYYDYYSYGHYGHYGYYGYGEYAKKPSSGSKSKKSVADHADTDLSAANDSSARSAENAESRSTGSSGARSSGTSRTRSTESSGSGRSGTSRTRQSASSASKPTETSATRTTGRTRQGSSK